MRNAKWSEDEVVLLVDLYSKLAKQGKSLANSPHELQELSDLLRHHAAETNSISDTFRNLAGLKMKCANIKSLVDGRGLTHTSLLEQSVVEMMISDPDSLHEHAKQIRADWEHKI